MGAVLQWMSTPGVSGLLDQVLCQESGINSASAAPAVETENAWRCCAGYINMWIVFNNWLWTT